MAAGASASIPCVTLNTGHAMPVLGFGTGSSSTPPDLSAIIVDAVRLGYRHIDTASLYGTEGAVGAAVADAVRAGAVASREGLFVTSKLWVKDAHPDRVLPALRESLARLGLDYLDLFLVHWPVAADENKKLVPFDMEGVWRAMEECHRLGLARSIGVSNFSSAKMSRLLSFAAVPPAVNQVELNVGWRQEKVREVCAKNRVVVTAFSPLGAFGAAWGSNAVMENGVLQDVAARRGKTLAQVALRWLHEQGVCFVVRSFNRERLKQNMELFDWELMEDDKELIMQIPQRRACKGEFFLSPEGPYKSLEELWDGEI
ncbi:Non-functional NADPH-dependent codeinone reductase 2 [Dichanthelium oligosanthes]|uniref:Non-functional NADPH-dependent codeinone reductase 2 n=1 Tax=Dichanthelium oligosanthes TaxID=888268 RepID=A0A1E5VP61_9POAL|nr:Non-functional NADPH-dependent codeinone reductase 2 [Dichanthelium oligosanthes]